MHVDPVGTLIVPALLSLGGVGFFGWAKPVPVNVGRLRSPRNQGVLVSLAGPAMNALLAARLRRSSSSTSSGRACSRPEHFSTGAQIVFYASLVNVGLCAFNLIPVPPLDGSVALRAPAAGALLADVPAATASTPCRSSSDWCC